MRTRVLVNGLDRNAACEVACEKEPADTTRQRFKDFRDSKISEIQRFQRFKDFRDSKISEIQRFQRFKDFRDSRISEIQGFQRFKAFFCVCD
jgi:hypothetical protein